MSSLCPSFPYKQTSVPFNTALPTKIWAQNQESTAVSHIQYPCFGSHEMASEAGVTTNVGWERNEILSGGVAEEGNLGQTAPYPRSLTAMLANFDRRKLTPAGNRTKRRQRKLTFHWSWRVQNNGTPRRRSSRVAVCSSSLTTASTP